MVLVLVCLLERFAVDPAERLAILAKNTKPEFLGLGAYP